jgi:hypothetical protein
MAEEAIKKAMASANAQKAWVTRKTEDVMRLLAVLRSCPTQDGLDKVKKKLEEVEECARKAEAKYTEAVELETDDDKLDQYIARQAEMARMVVDLNTEVMTAAFDTQAALRPAPRLPHAAAGPVGGGGTSGQRLQEALKPDMLTTDASPEDMTQWKDEFGTYYRRSGVDQWPVHRDKQNVLLGCLDKGLKTQVKHHPLYNEARPVLRGDPPMGDSLEEILDDIFLEVCPTFSRRLEFFNMMQDWPSEDVSHFVGALEDRAREADIATMTRDDTLIFRCLTGVKDEGMLKEWRRLDNPTWEEMKRAVKKYMASKREDKATKAARGPARAARTQERKEPSKTRPRSQSRGPPRIGDREIPEEWRELCLRCGQKGHQASGCPKSRTDVKCTGCGKMGHVATICLKTWFASSAKASSSSNPDGEGEASDDSDAGMDSRVNRIRVARAGPNIPTPQFTMRAHQGIPSERFRLTCTPDTGATRTIISADLVDRHQMFTRYTKAQLFSAKEGERMECSRKVELHARAEDGNRSGPSTVIHALVSHDLKNEVLVSWHDLKRMGILPEAFPAVLAYARAAAASASQDISVDDLYKEYEDVLRDTLTPGKRVKGPPMCIKFKTGAHVVPRKRLTTRPVPLHMQEKADALLAELMSEDVLGRLDENTVTDWLHRGHFVFKPDGRVRLVTDFITMNEFIERPVHPFPSPDAVFKSIKPGSKWFAKLDALHGYFQIPLDKESQMLTAFLLPQGRFFYKVAPMGLNPSGDWWCSKSDEALVGLEGVTKLVDDILVQAETREVLIQRIRAVLDRCRTHGIVLSKKKVEIGQRVSFAGHIVSDKGVEPDPEKLEAITDFPSPKDQSGLRGFLGLANQLGHYLPDLAAATVLTRQLLKKGAAWVWMPEHEKEFQQVKKLLTSPTVVKYFDPALPSTILTDASTEGLGYALVQHNTDGELQLISCGSRCLNPAESRYAPVELECLGIQFAVEKCDFYLRGSPKTFKVVTDHRPLVGMWKKPLSETPNPRLQRIRLKTVGLNIVVEWQPGKHNVIADALSRSPVAAPAPMTPEEVVEEQAFARAVNTDGSLRWICEAAREDESYQEVVRAKEAGTVVARLPTTHPAHLFKSAWDSLGLEKHNGELLLVYDGDRLVVPPSARKRVLDILHMPHAGLVKTRKAAQQLYFWPGMNAGIADRINGCQSCTEALPSKPAAPLTEPPATSQPMEAVGADLFAAGGKNYLVMVDRFSGFPFVHKMTKTDSASVVRAMQKWFYCFGFPSSIRSDGGPQFRTDFKKFCWDNGIAHETSSPYYPQSNGLAEAAVKNTKKLLVKCTKEGEDYQAALHEFRNCPRADGFSPAQLMFGQRQRSALPVLPPAMQPIVRQEGAAARQRTADGARTRTEELRKPDNFEEGDEVVVQNPATGAWDARAQVLSKVAGGERSYTLFFHESERMSRRNEKFLRPVSAATTGEGGVMSDSTEDENANTSVIADESPSDRGPRRSERIREKEAKKKVRFDI